VVNNVQLNKDNKKVVKKEKIMTPSRIVWNRLKKNKLAMAGLYILIFMVLFSLLGPLLSPYKINDIDVTMAKLPPSAKHWLGTDLLGRDILFRLMLAGRISLAVGIVSVCIQVIIGSLVGAIAGFYGGWVDSILMRVVDIFMSLPFLPILIILGAVLSDMKVPSQYRIFVVMFMIGFMTWPSLARLVRGQILSLREQEFMQAAQALGLRDTRKIFKHLLPNTIPSIIVSATLGIGGAILTESALSYLGLGVTPPTPSWGNMIQAVNNLVDLNRRPWLWVPPGIAIFVTVMAINLLGDGLRDALDPKLKK
jgi:peptide/nickel transport system permease protein